MVMEARASWRLLRLRNLRIAFRRFGQQRRHSLRVELQNPVAVCGVDEDISSPVRQRKTEHLGTTIWPTILRVCVSMMVMEEPEFGFAAGGGGGAGLG